MWNFRTGFAFLSEFSVSKMLKKKRKTLLVYDYYFLGISLVIGVYELHIYFYNFIRRIAIKTSLIWDSAFH